MLKLIALVSSRSMVLNGYTRHVALLVTSSSDVALYLTSVEVNSASYRYCELSLTSLCHSVTVRGDAVVTVLGVVHAIIIVPLV